MQATKNAGRFSILKRNLFSVFHFFETIWGKSPPAMKSPVFREVQRRIKKAGRQGGLDVRKTPPVC
jgi:hypothetical protein